MWEIYVSKLRLRKLTNSKNCCCFFVKNGIVHPKFYFSCFVFRLGKRALICPLLFTCNYVLSVWRGFLFLWVLGMGYVILLWHSLSLPYNYLAKMILLDFWSLDLKTKLNSEADEKV